MKRKLQLTLIALSLVSPGLLAEESPYSGTATVIYEQSPLNFAFEVGYVTALYKNYQFGSGARITERNQGAHVALEWMPYASDYGKFSIGAGVSGGVVANTVVGQNAEGKDIYSSLTAIPLELHIGYRAEYFVNQFLVPFVKTGPSIIFAGETSKTGGARSGSYTSANWDYVAGLELNLSAMDPATSRSLDTSMGINGTYLGFEYVSSRSVYGSRFPDLTRNEYRLNLRFEI